MTEASSGLDRGRADLRGPRRGRARWAASPGLHALLLVAFALALWLPLGFGRAAIHGDRAYFTYFGQALLRGEPIYSTDFLGYPPIGPMVSAGAMAVERLFGIPTHLAPRHAALAVAVLCVLGVYAVARRATGSGWAALVAGVALAGFERWGWSAFSTLEPKHLVMLLGLAAGLALQARRPVWAGLASALAVGCYQPAGVAPVASAASLLWEARRAPGRPLAAWAIGFAAGTLPTLAYLAATDAWWDWWQRAVVIPASFELPQAGASPLRPIEVVRAEFGGDLGLFALGSVGFATFAAGSLRGGLHGLAEAWLGARNAGMPLLTLLWGAFSTWTFGGVADVYVLLPLVAFWAGWAAGSALPLLARLAAAGGAAAAGRVAAAAGGAAAARARRRRGAAASATAPPRAPERAGGPPGAPELAGGVVLALVAACALRPSAEFLRRSEMRGNPLANQERLVEYVDALAGRDGPVVAISAEELYALRDRRSPLPFLRLSAPCLPFLPLLGFEDCRAALEGVLAQDPAVVVVRLGERASDCERGVGRFLAPHGYRLVRQSSHVFVYARADRALRLPPLRPGSPAATPPRGTR